MKFLCPSCDQLVEPSNIGIHPGRFESTCPKCGHTEHIIADQPSPPEPPSGSSEAPVTTENQIACPKCGAQRQGREACPTCGLIFQKWSEGNAEAPPRQLEVLWKELLESWEDQKVHQHFLSLCLTMNALDFAAKCYRQRGDQRSKEQLERITVLCLHSLKSEESQRRLNPKTFRIIGWLVFFIISIGFVVLAFKLR